MDRFVTSPDRLINSLAPHTTLLSLPIELLQLIALYLDCVSTTALTLAAKPLYHALGTAAWATLNDRRASSTPAARRAALVRILARDRRKSWELCESCIALHPAGSDGGLIGRRMRSCAEAASPDVVGCAGLGIGYAVYPRAVAMVYRRLVGGPSADDSSCAEILRRGHVAEGQLGIGPFVRNIEVAVGIPWTRASGTGESIGTLSWRASYSFHVKDGGLDRLIAELMRHSFRACEHMVWEDRYQASLLRRVDLNNYMYHHLLLGANFDVLRCRYCETSFSATTSSGAVMLRIDVQKLFYAEGERMGRVVDYEGLSATKRYRRQRQVTHLNETYSGLGPTMQKQVKMQPRQSRLMRIWNVIGRKRS